MWWEEGRTLTYGFDTHSCTNWTLWTGAGIKDDCCLPVCPWRTRTERCQKCPCKCATENLRFGELLSHPYPGYTMTLWQMAQCWAEGICCGSVAKSCPTLCDPMDCSTPGFPVLHSLPEFAQTHIHWVSDAIQSVRPLSSPFPPAFNLSQCQGLFKWVSSLHQVAKALELQLQRQSFQWIFRVDSF